MKTSSDSLLTVINDILDFSKIEAGKIDLEDIDFNLRDFLEATLKMLALRADEKDLELLCEIAPEVPELVQGDLNRLRQIIVNLVGNAIKFTQSGEVVLKAQLGTHDSDSRIAREQADPVPSATSLALRDSQSAKTSLRILLAEDNLVNQRLAVRMLEKRGHTITIAGNGREALEGLEKDNFDLLVMDVQMPEMDGLEAVAGIRKKEMASGGHQMVVALTAHAMKGDQERCLSAGMDGTKPIRPQELDDVLARYAGKSVSPAFSRDESRGG